MKRFWHWRPVWWVRRRVIRDLVRCGVPKSKATTTFDRIIKGQ